MMEVYAGALSYADNQIGRLLDAVQDLGQLDNTLVIFIMGDNGASAEGSLQGTTHYPVGWAHAMDAPMQWTKQVASHFGGTRNGMVISWPARIKDKGGIRSQFCHRDRYRADSLRGCWDHATKIWMAVRQKPLEGVSLVYTFDNANAPTRHTTQYFELVGNRGNLQRRLDGEHDAASATVGDGGFEPNPDDFKWELYNIRRGFQSGQQSG